MYKKKVLEDKLEVVISPMPHMESIAISVWIGLGGRYEEANYNGISHFIEHMLFKGTEERSASQLKQAIEGIGGHFNGFTAEEVTCYLIKIPAKHYKLGMEVLSDMVLNPKLDEFEIEKEKEVICEEIKMYKDLPSSYVSEILVSIMWPDHPLGKSLTGDVETVRAMNRSIILRNKERYYKPANMAIIAAGKINEDKFVNSAMKCFNGKDWENNKKLSYKDFKLTQKEKKVKLLFKDIEQTHIAFGFHAMGRNDKDKYALNILNIIAGGNMSSRLFEELREKKALCYDISSSLKKLEETGAFFIHAGIDNSKVTVALSSIVKELNRLKKETVPKEELKRAKEYYKGQLLLALEDTGSRMLWLGDKLMTKEGIPTIGSILKSIEKVKPEDVLKVADKVFRNDILNFSAIGPEASLKEDDVNKLLEV